MLKEFELPRVLRLDERFTPPQRARAQKLTCSECQAAPGAPCRYVLRKDRLGQIMTCSGAYIYHVERYPTHVG